MCYLVLANQNSKRMYGPSRSGRERKERKLGIMSGCVSLGRFLYLIGEKVREKFPFYPVE